MGEAASDAGGDGDGDCPHHYGTNEEGKDAVKQVYTVRELDDRPVVEIDRDALPASQR